jgi:AbrB family looped-hinge helix DNA binding protein
MAKAGGQAAGKSTVSSKGQVTIPKAVRDRYGLVAGTEVVFEVREEGALLTRPRQARHPAWDAMGSLQGIWRWPRGIPRTVDAYIDYVRGGSYSELEGKEKPTARRARRK